MSRFVKIPFYDRFENPMLIGSKTSTARTSRKGDVGDRFRAFGAVFEIVAVERVQAVELIARWKEEGCSSPGDFVLTWRKIHPRLPWDRNVWLHTFRRVE